MVIAAAEHPLADVAEAAVQQAQVVEHQRHAGPQRNGEPVGALHDARMQILVGAIEGAHAFRLEQEGRAVVVVEADLAQAPLPVEADRRALGAQVHAVLRSEEHTSELQSLMRISYAVFRLKTKK